MSCFLRIGYHFLLNSEKPVMSVGLRGRNAAKLIEIKAQVTLP
jgi:hypothetical protein